MSLGSIMPLVDKVLSFIPNPQEKARVQSELMKAEQSGELQTILAQLAVNKQEAAHKSLFVAGWRPFCGWVCGLAMAYHFIVAPFLDIWVTVPKLDMSDLMTVLLGMLGMGGLRTYEKYRGVARSS